MTALAIGLLIGLTLGALGGGGSVLTVPALVYLLGQSARAATTESLIVVGAAALGAVFAHARAGSIRWGTGLAFGFAGIVASYAGSAANAHVNPRMLLLAFAALMLVAAAAMRAQRGGVPADRRHRSTARVAVRVLAAGSLTGFLTGFLGVGGGFVIVPALVMLLDFQMSEAVATSLLIISINSGTALLARVGGHTAIDWSLVIPFTAAALAGSLAGRNLATRLPAHVLRTAFTTLLLSVASYTAYSAVTARKI